MQQPHLPQSPDSSIPEAIEQINHVLDSPAWRVFAQLSIAPVIKRWNYELLENNTITQDQRNGYIFARREMKEGFLQMYAKCKRTPPTWLKEIFDGK